MVDWQDVHGKLMGIAAKRAGLDAEEARWLRVAAELRLWRRFGMVSAADYMERVLGYAPRTANERLRVARALAELPEIEAALGRGELQFSAVKEVTRVATAETEREWLDAVVGKSLRMVEQLVAGKTRGDRPDDPARPEARRRIVILELDAEVYARLREVRARLADEDGRRLDDNALVRVLCDAVESGAEPGAAKYQVAIAQCPACKQAWQDGGGERIAIDAATFDRACCDAQHIGSLDAAEPTRATQTVPPAIVRLVWRRDQGRCRVPGCRSARGLEIHHLIHREDGGGHDADNLILACSACHDAHHRGALRLIGTAKDVRVERPCEPRAHVGSNMRHDAQTALVTLGFAPREADQAISVAIDRIPVDAPLELLLRASLRELRPRA
jgi:hypothetical protein